MANQQKAKQYERLHLILSLSETVLSLLLVIYFVVSGLSSTLDDLVSTWSSNPYVQLIVFLGIAGGSFSVILFPFSFISGFWLEHRYGLSNQTLFQWLWEKAKASMVGLVLFLPVVIVFYYFLRSYPDTWWIWTATILFLFSVVLGRIAPQVIFPLFYKFERLEDEQIVKRMKRLSEKGRFNLDGVYRFNMSKTTSKANAAFTGLGKSKRIILGDTLLETLSHDEIESVFAHEVGHYTHKHLLIGVVTGTITSYLSLFLADLIYEGAVNTYGFSGLDDLAALPMLTVILSILTFFISPVSNMLSRFHERQADRYALENSTDPGAFLTALEKLADKNLTDRTPSPVIEFLFHSHPSLEKRLRFAESIRSDF
jgi:STE24 endopeptidase